MTVPAIRVHDLMMDDGLLLIVFHVDTFAKHFGDTSTAITKLP